MNISTRAHGSIDMPADEIIIVDDNNEWREILAAILELEGHVVTEFADGNSFLDEAARRTPICTFLDVFMPGPSGLDVLEKLNEIAYQAPIFLISAHADAPVVLQGVRNGVLGVLEKPFDPYSAVLRVRHAVDLWAHRVKSKIPVFAGLQFIGDVRLTRQECAMLAQIAAGISNDGAARSIGISPGAAAKCRAEIKEKFGVKTLADLVRIAHDEVAKAKRDLVDFPIAIEAHSPSPEKSSWCLRSETLPVRR
ncbi:MAG TPA: response regulator [Gemmatimonadaceae bacterium]|nr:response regulator [Gemmatimonadaceae bacterium]